MEFTKLKRISKIMLFISLALLLILVITMLLDSYFCPPEIMDIVFTCHDEILFWPVGITMLAFMVMFPLGLILLASIKAIERIKKQPVAISKKKQMIIISSIAIILFFIILFGFIYLHKNPFVFHKKLPAVMVINIDGEIVTTTGYGIYEKRGQNRTGGTTSMNIIRMLEYFSKDDSIKAFILEIDSYGGQTAGKEEIVRYIKRMDKPVVAVITNKALSSGYFVAASTDKIYASESSQIGKLADTFVYVNRNRYGEEQVCHITSSNYDTITLEQCKGFDWLTFERLRLLVQGTHELLVRHIAEMRGLSQSDVKTISNDRIMTSNEALQYGLIDEIGTTSDVVNWLEKELNTKLWIVYLRDMLPSST